MLTTDLDARQLAAVRAIYEDAFPEDLRADFDSLLVDRLVVRVTGAGTPEGLAVLRPLGDTGWVFLRYYAVGVRGGGVGTAMLAELGALLAAEGRSLLVWDVEDPDEPGLAAHEVEEHRRRIAFYDTERQQRLVFITNNFALPALTITQLYKCRWQIELFFKWIKQHLRIKAFYGTSVNAVKTQIWIAISVYVLVAIVKKELRVERSLYEILQVLSITLFEKTPLFQALTTSKLPDSNTRFPNQLTLFDL